MKIRVKEIEKRVIALLDENEAILDERVTYGDPETELRTLIEMLLPDAARMVLAGLPASRLSECSRLPVAGLRHLSGSMALLPLPDDFLRLLYFRMSDWDRRVSEALVAGGEAYQLRFREGGRRRRGAVAVTGAGEEKMLEIFGTGSDSTVVSACYLGAPEIVDGMIDIPASALYDIASKIASMVKELTEHND